MVVPKGHNKLHPNINTSIPGQPSSTKSKLYNFKKYISNRFCDDFFAVVPKGFTALPKVYALL
jgi:hypothetical protein